MNLLIWICLTQAIWPKALAVYHVLSMQVFRPPRPLRNDSFFGYSVTYYPEHKTLVISAPTENNIGEVYECDIQHHNCKTIDKNIPRVSANYKHDYWFGATVKAGPNFVVMCAPRYTARFENFKEYGERGQCYYYSKGRLTPLRTIDDAERYDDTRNLLFETNMDSFGWSTNVAFDDSIIVGGPGMYTGRAMIYKPNRPTPIFMRRNTFTPAFNFGYSVSSGTFINNHLSYAVGSTYGKNGFGEVSFFKEIEKQNQLMKKVDVDVVGSMFGAVLCAAELTGQRTDLLVGAPTYACKSTYNLGAVYVYIAVKKGKPPEYKRTIKGQKDGSLFGSAIVSLGDLNGDKRDEIAIGAPFENDGRGVVYLYSGADLISEKTEKTLTWLQRIEPEPSLNFGKSFGFSLTPLLDYDDNGCNELAIGAPYSDAVVLVRCMAAITVKTFAVFPNLQNRTYSGKTDFEFKVCLAVEYPSKPNNIIADISTTVVMIHPHAFLTKAADKRNYTFVTSLRDKKPQYCSDVEFTLPLDGNYDIEINCQISSSLLNSPVDSVNFDSARVILSDRSVLAVQESVWAAECSGNKECVPNLALETQFSFKDEYIIGSTDKEQFEINLINTGEVAYDACLRVHIIGAEIFQTPSACEIGSDDDFDPTRVLCKPKTLRNNQKWTSGPIVLGMKKLTSLDRNITVNISLFNHCKDSKSQNFSRVILLKSDSSSVVVKGITDIGDPINMTTDDIRDGKHVEHVYEFMNRGPTTWKELTSFVNVQKKPYIKYNDIPIIVHVARSHSVCLMTENSTEWMRFTCNIDSLMVSAQGTQIRIRMDIVPGSLEGKLEDDKYVTINSKIDVLFNDIDNTTIHQSITTTVGLQEALVALWVIIVGVLVGLLILLIIAYILYRCGFLRRKNKEHLKELQRSVKRQTIRRSTMQTQAQSEERTNILERMNEENEDVPEKIRAKRDHK